MTVTRAVPGIVAPVTIKPAAAVLGFSGAVPLILAPVTDALRGVRAWGPPSVHQAMVRARPSARLT